jgi:hypothetical protein
MFLGKVPLTYSPIIEPFWEHFRYVALSIGPEQILVAYEDESPSNAILDLFSDDRDPCEDCSMAVQGYADDPIWEVFLARQAAADHPLSLSMAASGEPDFYYYIPEIWNRIPDRPILDEVHGREDRCKSCIKASISEKTSIMFR